MLDVTVYQLPSAAAHDDVVAAQLPDKTVVFQRRFTAESPCPRHTSESYDDDGLILSYKTEEDPDGRLVAKPITSSDFCLVVIYDTFDASGCIHHRLNLVVEECAVDYIFHNSEYLPI